MLEQFETSSDRYSGRFNVAKHCIKLEPSNQLPIYSELYDAESEVSDLEIQEGEQMLPKTLI